MSTNMTRTTIVVRASIIVGMALFYLTFLLSVMKYFEKPEAILSSKTAQSTALPDRIVVSTPNHYTALPTLQKQPMVYLKSRVYPSPTASSQGVELLSTARSRREIKDYSQISFYRIYDDSDHFKVLFPSSTIQPRLREPMGGQMVRNALGWLRSAKSIISGTRAVGNIR